MDFFGIPAEVVDAYVLPHFGWNDLLRLRRVCKWTKAITDGYLKVHPELAPEIEINEEDKDFRAFLKMGIPTTRIFLNNSSGAEFYEKGGEAMLEFLEDFGSLMRFLRLDQISYIIIGKEQEFLDVLQNLQSLEADRYGGYPRGLDPEKASQYILMKWEEAEEDYEKMIPGKLMSQLRTLKIGNNDDEELGFEDLFIFIQSFLARGKALESIAVPFSFDAKPIPKLMTQAPAHLAELIGRPLAFAITLVSIPILGRSRNELDVAIYKNIDFVNYNQEEAEFSEELGASPFFLHLCRLCIENNVKLENVGSTWFVARKSLGTPKFNSPDLGIPVRSLVNLHPDVLWLDTRNLERIEIKSTARSSAGQHWRSNNRSNLLSLGSLDITVDSTLGEYFKWDEQRQTALRFLTTTMELFNFFFEDVSRTAMTELRLEFSEGGTGVIPNTEHIVASCPNLKKLTLIDWPGTNKALTKLWNGLCELEEVSLENCKALGNVAFVGDVRSPVFLKLKKLKKLSLNGLDMMPKITDTLFSLVLRHMELTHLTLTSNAPLKSITGPGVRMLCDGRFAGSIEKFPFKGWSLENLSAEEFKKLEDMFRSSKML